MMAGVSDSSAMLAPDQVEVGRLGGVLGHHLDEAGVVDAVVVVVPGMHVERDLGDGAAAHVEHIGQALADRGVERLVHEGDALARREVGGAQAGHRHAGGDAGGGVLGFRLDEDQRPCRKCSGGRRRPPRPSTRPSASTA
jgi:hypothetical protein